MTKTVTKTLPRNSTTSEDDFLTRLAMNPPPPGMSLHEWVLQERATLTKENLRILIKDVLSAYNDKAIDERELEDLLTHLCSMFIEIELDTRLRKTLTLKLPLLYTK